MIAISWEVVSKSLPYCVPRLHRSGCDAQSGARGRTPASSAWTKPCEATSRSPAGWRAIACAACLSGHSGRPAPDPAARGRKWTRCSPTGAAGRSTPCRPRPPPRPLRTPRRAPIRRAARASGARSGTRRPAGRAGTPSRRATTAAGTGASAAAGRSFGLERTLR